MLTPQMIQKMNAVTGANVPTTPGATQATPRSAQIRALGKTVAPAPEAPAPTIAKPTVVADAVGAIKDQASGGADQMKEAAGEIKNGEGIIPAVESGLKYESGLASIVTSPLAPLFAPVKAAVGAIADKVSDIPAVQKFAMSDAGKTTARVAGDLANAGNIAGSIAGGEGLEKGVDYVKNGGAPEDLSQLTPAERSAKITSKYFGEDKAGAATPETKTTAPATDSAAQAKTANDDIVSSYTKAVKPTTAGKTGPGQLDKYNESVTSAVKSITNNTDNLKFETEDGNVETGRTPQTRGELADALAQTKAAVFSKYDALAKQAGEAGAKVSLAPAAKSLQGIVENEALKITNPHAIEYAKGIIERLQNEDGSFKDIDAKTAQDVVTNYNSSLKAFYRNPSYESASRAAIDAGVVHEVRAGLDKSINDATGQDYQGIKNEYGALSSIEKDVNKAALTQAKQTGSTASGLGKYVDVFSGGDMVSGLLSLNPALFAKGAAQAGIAHFFQWFNSPDRAVGNMFKAASRLPK